MSEEKRDYPEWLDKELFSDLDGAEPEKAAAPAAVRDVTALPAETPETGKKKKKPAAEEGAETAEKPVKKKKKTAAEDEKPVRKKKTAVPEEKAAAEDEKPLKKKKKPASVFPVLPCSPQWPGAQW